MLSRWRPFDAIWIVVAVVVVRLWVMPMTNSFWLDETLIASTVREGIGEILASSTIRLQSVAFCIIEWVVSKFAGSGEFALRLPSVLAGVCAIAVMFKLGEEVVDRHTGVICGVLYAIQPQIIFEMPDARPYSLALLAETGSMLALARWLRSGERRHLALWLACAVAAAHLHHLFGTILAIHVSVAVLRAVRDQNPGRAKQVLVAAVASFILLLPAIPQLRTFATYGKLLSFSGVPDMRALVDALSPIVIALPVALVIAVELLTGRRPRFRDVRQHSVGLQLALLTGLFPILCFFAISVGTEFHIFNSRYLLPTIPGMVLLWGILLRAIEPIAITRFALVGAAAWVTFTVGGFRPAPDYKREDWRAAVAALPDSGPLLVYSGLVESRRRDWLQDQARWKYIVSPVLVYRPTLQTENTLLLPFSFGAEDQRYVELLVSTSKTTNTVSVIARTYANGPSWVDWIGNRLASAGYSRSSHSSFEGVDVAVFRR